MAQDKGRNVVQDEISGDEDDDDTQKNRYLTFHLGEEDYGIEIRHVIEIVGIQKITEVPDMPMFIKGVVNLRGQVIPVMDVRMRFNMEQREYDDRTCVIVVKVRETSIGLIVDTVSEVREIAESDIAPPPKVARGESSRYIMGLGKVGDEVKILLNVNRLLFDDEMEELEGLNN